MLAEDSRRATFVLFPRIEPDDPGTVHATGLHTTALASAAYPIWESSPGARRGRTPSTNFLRQVAAASFGSASPSGRTSTTRMGQAAA